MKKQAQNFGAEYLHGAVIDTDLSNRPFRLNVEGEWIETRTLIIASGASARWLGLEIEQKLIGHGVSSCATCDGFFYRGKKIMVVGGGDSAMEEANFLTRFGSEVTPGAPPRGVPRLQDHAGPRAPQSQNQVPHQHRGGRGLRRLAATGHRRAPAQREDRRQSGTRMWTVSSSPSATFPTPRCSRARSRPIADGYILSKGGARTNIAGVFHAGDVQDRTYRQAITASGAGCMAAIEAERYLEAEGH